LNLGEPESFLRNFTPMKIRTQSILMTFALLCLGLLAARAVSPPPNGGYAGGNTAEGQNALLNGGGTYNTAVGLFALESNVTGDFNTSIGAGTLLAHGGNGENTAVGAGALLSDTGGFRNTASGAFALFSNTEGSFNTAIGNGALYNNTIGGENTAIENDALSYNTNLLNTGGSDNTAIKVRALYNNTIGSGNTAWKSERVRAFSWPITLFVSARLVRTWTTAAISATFPARTPLAAMQSSLLAKENSAR